MMLKKILPNMSKLTGKEENKNFFKLKEARVFSAYNFGLFVTHAMGIFFFFNI